MQKLLTPYFILPALVFLLSGLGTSIAAQENFTEPIETPAVKGMLEDGESTSHYPEIPLDLLRLSLKPLSAEELEKEADAWLGLLKEKTTQISKAEIASKLLKQEIEEDSAVVEDKEDGNEQAAEEDAEATPRAEIAIEGEPDEAEDDGSRQERTETIIDATQDITADMSAESAAELLEREKLDRTHLLESITQLRDERVGVIDRLNVVLDEWQKKGGEVDYYEKYISAVSGISVDVSDTSAMWITAKGWLLAPSGGIRWSLNIIQFIAILLFTLLLRRIAISLTRRALGKANNLSELLRDFLQRMVGRVVMLVGLIVALGALEINIGPVLAVIGAAGFVVAFALQDTLSNFASGLLIMVYEPFDVGDAISAAGISGTVVQVSLVSTTIKTWDNQVVIVPNNDVWKGTITNITGSPTRRVDLVFGIGYNSDMAKAEEILTDIVKSHEKILEDPEPVIKVHELADSSVNFVCRPWVKTPDYWGVYWDITRKVKERFDDAGISIPFPQTDVHIHQVKE